MANIAPHLKAFQLRFRAAGALWRYLPLHEGGVVDTWAQEDMEDPFLKGKPCQHQMRSLSHHTNTAATGQAFGHTSISIFSSLLVRRWVNFSPLFLPALGIMPEHY